MKHVRCIPCNAMHVRAMLRSRKDLERHLVSGELWSTRSQEAFVPWAKRTTCVIELVVGACVSLKCPTVQPQSRALTRLFVVSCSFRFIPVLTLLRTLFKCYWKTIQNSLHPWHFAIPGLLEEIKTDRVLICSSFKGGA